MAEHIEILKFNLQERQFPYFEENELQMLLDQYNDVNTASYYGCIMKAQSDEIKLGPIQTASNKEYWLNLAKQFKPVQKYNTSMRRADGQ